MEQITVGLDFGTHQTKICVQSIPDEGHGQPRYEFFQFKDLDGNDSYFLPSVIQVNRDNTLSYGFVDPAKEKAGIKRPERPKKNKIHTMDVGAEADRLYSKYAYMEDKSNGIAVLKEMLNIINDVRLEKHSRNAIAEETAYAHELEEYKRNRKYYEYFKQASFTD